MTVVTAPTVTSKVAIPNAFAEYRAPLNSSAGGRLDDTKVELFKAETSWAETFSEGTASAPEPRLKVVRRGGGTELKLKSALGLGTTPGRDKTVVRLGGGAPCSSVSVNSLARCRRSRTIGTASAAVVTASYFQAEITSTVRV